MCRLELSSPTAFFSFPPPQRRTDAAQPPEEEPAPPSPPPESDRGCICSPTGHPGSFRCRKHRKMYQFAGQRRS